MTDFSADTEREGPQGDVVRRPAGLFTFRGLKGGRAISDRWWPFTLPALALVGGFFVLPFVLNVRFAFTDWSGYQDTINWTGLDNFHQLSALGIYWPAVKVTLLYAVIAMLVQNTFSLSMALLLQSTTRTNTFFRSLFFLPVLIAPVAAGYIWHAILAYQGPLNAFISVFVPGFHYEWLGHPNTALIAVASIDAWKYSGLVTLVYIAGLNSIPRSLTDAATADGANAWRCFWHVRFRLLAPAFTFSVVVTLIGALSAFDIVQATTRGGPGTSTTVLNVALYSQYGSGFFGMASALSLTVAALVVLIAIPLMAILRRREIQA